MMALRTPFEIQNHDNDDFGSGFLCKTLLNKTFFFRVAALFVLKVPCTAVFGYEA